MRNAVKITKKANLRIRGYFIIGFPTETKEEILQTISFAKELDIDMPTFTAFCPFPGSADYSRCQNEGKFDPDYYKKLIIPEFNFMNKLIYIPNGFSESDIVSLRKKAYRNCYFRPKAILRHLSKIRSFGELFAMIKGGTALLSNTINWRNK